MSLRADQTLLSTTGGAKSVATSAPVISREFRPAPFNSIITFLSLSTEYAAGLADGQHPWEESRGMAHSYGTAAFFRSSCPDLFFLARSGYNRAESLSDYKTGEEFIFMLVDIVSRGGNLLLNVGPSGTWFGGLDQRSSKMTHRVSRGWHNSCRYGAAPC